MAGDEPAFINTTPVNVLASGQVPDASTDDVIVRAGYVGFTLTSERIAPLVYDTYTQPHIRMIEGELKDGRKLSPISVWVSSEGGQTVVSEPLFHMHGYSSTLAEALDDFRSVVVDELEALEEDEAHLSPQLQSQLHYLRSIVISA